MFSKIALPVDTVKGASPSGNGHQVVSPERERQAMKDFIQCEQDVKFSDSILDPQFIEDFKRVSGVLFGDMFDEVEETLSRHHIIPKHGPGSVADRLSSNGKFNQRTWTARLESVFPAQDYLSPSRHFIADTGQSRCLHSESALTYCKVMSVDKIDVLEPGSEIPVRVIAVPKTLKTPRIIAIEPTCMQYMQQGLFAILRDAMNRDDFLSRVIGIDDQEPNRSMARQGSLRGDLATLDLSEASDRVSNQHVLALFAGHPLLSEAVQATRSRKADVPGFGVKRLAKFASMGSALCFPVEAMVFVTVIFCGIERELSAPLTCAKDLGPFRKQVRVFGDDLIVPADYVLSVVDELHTFGYVVNISKSFWTGRFRESCGREFYDGHDVSIVKVRRVLPTRRQDAAGVIASVELRNQFYWSGTWQAARWLDSYMEKILRYFPNVAPTSPVLGRESVLGYQFQTLDPYTHSPLVRGYYVHAKPPRDPLDGAGALLKCLLRKEKAPHCVKQQDPTPTQFDVASVDGEHLERSGRPEHVNIKLGRMSPF
jgi:hypothetical protein